VDDGYAAVVSAGEVGHPTLLTTGLARAASAVFLTEADLDRDIEPDMREEFIDMAGVLLGFGVILANGSHVAQKSCGGATVHRATALAVEELVGLLALFCQLHRIPPRTAKGELDREPARHFDEAVSWASNNAGLISLLASDRLAIDGDSYRIAPSRGFFTRLFGIGQRQATLPSDDDLAQVAIGVQARGIDPEKARRMAALRELVDDSLE
jgi:hypothetical protein